MASNAATCTLVHLILQRACLCRTCVRNERPRRDSAKLSPFRADEADGVFDAAKKKALETVQAMMDGFR